MEIIPEFEYDPIKSRANAEKHGIDFEAAQALWSDECAIGLTARSDDEARFAVIGLIGEKHWTVFFTFRGEAIRIISARRARISEARIYDSQKHQR